MKSGDSVHFSGSMKVTCTAYTAGYGGVGTRTATGTTVHVGTVAVDKKVIPLGTEMFIVGSSGYTYGNAVAEDTGVRGAAINLYMNSYQECKQFGRQKNSTVYFFDERGGLSNSTINVCSGCVCCDSGTFTLLR